MLQRTALPSDDSLFVDRHAGAQRDIQPPHDGVDTSRPLTAPTHPQHRHMHDSHARTHMQPDPTRVPLIAERRGARQGKAQTLRRPNECAPCIATLPADERCTLAPHCALVGSGTAADQASVPATSEVRNPGASALGAFPSTRIRTKAPSTRAQAFVWTHTLPLACPTQHCTLHGVQLYEMVYAAQSRAPSGPS